MAALADELEDLYSKGNKGFGIDLDTSDAVAGLDDLGAKLDGLGGSLGSIGDTIKTAFSFEAIGSLGEALSSFEEQGAGARDALRSVAAQTGLTGVALEGLQDRAEDAFLNGIGGSVEEATKALGTAQQQLGAFLDPAGMDAFLQRAGGIGKVFDKDVSEVVQKSRTFIAQFGLEGQEAGDLISLAMQRAGNGMDDVLDTTDEYSQLVKEAGFSAQEFVGILTTGIQAGVRDTDKLADAMKETQIRLKAGDITSALAEINTPITAAIQGIVRAGEEGRKTSAQVMSETAAAIETAFDAGQISETMRSKLQVAVAGTPAEDIGAAMYGRVFGAPVDTSAITAQATQAGQQMAEAIGSQTIFESLSKNFDLITTKVSAFAGPIIGGLGDVLGVVGQIGPAIALILPALGGMGGIMATVGTAATAMWTAITGPVGLIVAAIAAIVAVFAIAYNTSDTFRKAIDDLWQGIKDFVDAVWQQLKPVLESVWELLKEVGSFIIDVLVGAWDILWTAISAVIDVIGGLIAKITGTRKEGSFLQTVLDGLGKAFGFLKKLVDGMRIGLAGIQGAFSGVINVVKGVIRAFTTGGLLEGVKAAFDAFTSIGDAASEGFKKGMEQKAAELERAAAEAAQAPVTPAVEAAASESGGKVGSAFGTGVSTAARATAARALINFGGEMAGLLEREFSESVDAWLRESLALAADEGDRIEATFFAEEQRARRAFQTKREQYRKQFEQDGAKPRKLTASEKQAFDALMAEVEENEREGLEKLNQARLRALDDFQTDLVNAMTAGSGIRELPPLRPDEKGAQFSIELEQEIQAELERTNLLYQSSAAIREGYVKGLFEAVDPAAEENARRELDRIRDEETALRFSLAKRKISQERYNSDIVALAEARRKAEQQLADSMGDIWARVLGGIQAGFEDLERRQREALTTALQGEDGKGGLTALITEQLKAVRDAADVGAFEIGKIGDAMVDVGFATSGVIGSIWGEMLATGRATIADLSNAALLTSINTIRTIIEGHIVQIIAAAFAVNPFLGLISIPGVLAVEALLAQWEAEAQSRLSNRGFRYGGYTGDGAAWEVAGAVHRGEYVWDRETTGRFLPVLDRLAKDDGKLLRLLAEDRSPERRDVATVQQLGKLERSVTSGLEAVATATVDVAARVDVLSHQIIRDGINVHGTIEHGGTTASRRERARIEQRRRRGHR